MNYYLELAGEVAGPYQGQDLRVMLLDRVITLECLIQPVGLSDWISLERWIAQLQLNSEPKAQRELAELLPQAESKGAPHFPDDESGSAVKVFLGVIGSLFAAAMVYYAILW
jgi:hypothetical protein